MSESAGVRKRQADVNTCPYELDYTGDSIGEYCRAITGDTRSLGDTSKRRFREIRFVLVRGRL